jgi:hypothetical protein
MVMQRAGAAPVAICVLVVSKDFRMGMPAASLFIEVDVTQEVQARVEEFLPLWDEVRGALVAGESPEPELKLVCGKCEYFPDCTGSGVRDHIFDFPRLHRTKFVKLRELNVESIHDVPSEFALTDQQKIVRDSVISGDTYVGPQLKEELAGILWPAAYLDFETVTTAIPLYGEVAPYEQVVTQYSIHMCDRPGHVVSHTEYLADPERDCREEVASRLLEALAGEGSVLVYSGFEATIIKGLARRFSSVAEDLLSLVGKVVDLEKIISRNFYHPEFRGRTSIKRTLPVLVKDLSYDDLRIKDGDTAMAIFADMARGNLLGSAAEEMRSALLEYCARDTLAMVRLHERLDEAARPDPTPVPI